MGGVIASKVRASGTVRCVNAGRVVSIRVSVVDIRFVIWRLLATALRSVALCGMLTFVVIAHETPESAAPAPQMHRPASGGSEERSAAPATVDVTPVAHDEEISRRLQSVLDATGWFTSARVRVDAGVVFLSGQTETEELRKWAGDLARSTQDVVAVANRIEVSRPSARVLERNQRMSEQTPEDQQPAKDVAAVKPTHDEVEKIA